MDNLKGNWEEEFNNKFGGQNWIGADRLAVVGFISRQIAKEKKACKEKLEHLENYYQKLVKMRDSEAEKRGTEKERDRIQADLLKIADDGEIEELRREVENYFKKQEMENPPKRIVRDTGIGGTTTL